MVVRVGEVVTRPGGRDSLEAVHNFLALERQPRLPLAAIDKDLVLAARGNLGFVWVQTLKRNRRLNSARALQTNGSSTDHFFLPAYRPGHELSLETRKRWSKYMDEPQPAEKRVRGRCLLLSVLGALKARYN